MTTVRGRTRTALAATLIVAVLPLTACGDTDASSPAAPSPPTQGVERPVPKVNEPLDPRPGGPYRGVPADRFTWHVE